jgi:hypothetical protein
MAGQGLALRRLLLAVPLAVLLAVPLAVLLVGVVV